MARDGAFNDLDAAFNFHPAMANMPAKGTAVGIKAIYYRFKGRSAHAGGSPHEGRSALDAVELMNVGVNYLREHVKSDVRMHYIITEGGRPPTSSPKWRRCTITCGRPSPRRSTRWSERVNKVAQGAALMTETTCEILRMGYYPLLSNHSLADLQYQAMQQIGPIQYTRKRSPLPRR